jgi:ribosomal protein S18 acetylase RimI-like enzyme
VTVAFRPLDPATDEPVLRRWLQGYLEEHVAWFLAARGRGDEDAATVVAQRDLVGRDWRNLVVAAQEPADERLVAIALSDDDDPRPAGLVEAGLTEDSFLGTTGGVLQWLVVDPGQRGRGVAHALVDHACAWFDARGADGSQLFVTQANVAAMRTYARAGFVAVDARMFRPGRTRGAASSTSDDERSPPPGQC